MKRTVFGLLCAALLLCAFGCADKTRNEAPEEQPADAVETEEIRPASTNGIPAPDIPVTEKTIESAPPEPTAEDRARELLEGMSLDEKIGQMFIARCPADGAAQAVSEYKLGGFVLFSRDFDGLDADTVRGNIAGYQDAADIPLIIAVDEEGGTVVRVSSNPLLRPSRFRSPQSLYSEGGLERILSDCDEKCGLLLSLGINVNLAPVADIPSDVSSFIYSRSFGRSAGETAEYVAAVASRMKAHGLGSALKHFPGYGGNTDTHTGTAVDTRSCTELEQSDFLPFIAGIEAGADMVLVSHNTVECMDEDLPASLSPEVHRVLREELGFEGVVVTDDLGMDAIGLYADGESAAVLAVLAGNDLILTTDYAPQIEAVRAAAGQGKIGEELIDAAVTRILVMKINLGLIEIESS